VDALGYYGGLGLPVAGETLISHFPLPSMPFQTHVNVIFESGTGEQVEKKARAGEAGSVEPIDEDTPVENLKLVDQRYAYHPDPNKLRSPDGQIVDFVVA
jgi:hypothetical protein